MRITNSMMVNSLNRNLNNNMINLDKQQRLLSTGKKLNSPSDDPAGLVTSLRLRTNMNENEQYLKNIGEAEDFLDTTDSALKNVNDILQRVRELTVQAANGTSDISSREAISKEITQLNEQLKLIANTTYGTKYVFAGRNVTEQPCQNNGWTGNNKSIELEIGIGVTIPINMTNESMNNFFYNNANDADPAKSGDNTLDHGIFTMMDNLAANIETGDSTGINTALGNLDSKINDLLYTRATIGAKTNRLDLQKNRLESTQTSYTSLLSENEDADMAEVIMNLKMEENVYQASLAAGARIIQPSLVDFLK